jgi:hypothetical protein
MSSLLFALFFLIKSSHRPIVRLLSPAFHPMDDFSVVVKFSTAAPLKVSIPTDSHPYASLC